MPEPDVTKYHSPAVNIEISLPFYYWGFIADLLRRVDKTIVETDQDIELCASLSKHIQERLVKP